MDEVKEEPEEKPSPEAEKKLNITFVVGIIAILLIFAVIFYFIRNPSEPSNEIITYNNFNFVQVGGLWATQWEREGQLFNVRLHYNPLEVEDVPLEGVLDTRFNQPSLFLTFDPRGENLSYLALTASEISLQLANAFDIIPIAACTVNETEACSIRPIITCDNTNDSVIFLKEDAEEKIILEGNCITIQGIDKGMLRAGEKFLYIWYRIIELE